MQYKVMIVYIVLCAYGCRKCVCAWSALDGRQISVIVYIIIYIQNVNWLICNFAACSEIFWLLVLLEEFCSLGGGRVDVHSPTKFGKCVHRSNNVQRLIIVMGNQSMKFGLRCH